MSLLIGPTISAAVVPASVVVFAVLFTYYLALDSREQKHRRYLEILRDSRGRDYIAVNMLAPQDRPTLRRAQSSVDTVLGTALHLSGQLLTTTRNTSLLCDLEWRIARDLYRVAEAERDLAQAELPQDGNEQDRAALERAAAALQGIREESEALAEAMHGYASQVQHTQGLLDEAKGTGEHRPISVNLPADSGRLPSEVTDSLAAAREEALKVSRLHSELDP